jgi:hypothetical protein
MIARRAHISLFGYMPVLPLDWRASSIFPKTPGDRIGGVGHMLADNVQIACGSSTRRAMLSLA